MMLLCKAISMYKHPTQVHACGERVHMLNATTRWTLCHKIDVDVGQVWCGEEAEITCKRCRRMLATRTLAQK